MVVGSTPNIMRMTIPASGYFCVKEIKLWIILSNKQIEVREKIRPGYNYCENLFFN